MLLDKGENILYLSHKIPELDELLPVFVEIWNAIHAPDVLLGDDEAVALVNRFIRKRLDGDEVLVPKCIRSFVDRQILIWIRNAFRAKNLLVVNDAYKIDDLKDGRGQQLVIMDKETGVEQVQMHWSHGLHQFLQLKHTLKLSPVSLKAVFMSNIAYFDQYKGKLYGLTGTLGSTTECDLLQQVFGVDFFTMPRFKPRFCFEEDALLADNRDDWLDNVYLATQTQLERERAVLIVCENIADVEAIHNRLFNEKNAAKIKQYVSSFDTEFQKKKHETPLTSGDVIVATNLAGRGTDFKIDDQLAVKGGLHVIIGYMPPNARVEARQAEGRTARAGQLGSYQFVLCSNQLALNSDHAEDVEVQLKRLKSKRDGRESRRLEKIRTQGLQKIFLEGKLLGRFHKEIYDVVKAKLNEGDNKEEYAKMQLDFLTNSWAMWLDENASHIENVHLKDAQDVEIKFEEFKTQSLAVCYESDLIKFAKSPTDLLILGRFFSESSDTKSSAFECFEKVARQEPSHCESALIHNAQLVLQKAGHDDKEKAKHFLKKANILIERKIDLIMALNDVVKRTAAIHQKAGAAKGENLFDEQLNNMGSLLQIHQMAIEDVLGRPVSRAIAVQFTNDAEIKQLVDLFEKLEGSDVCKPFRVSKKVSVNDDDVFLSSVDGTRKKIEWPSFLVQRKQSIIKVLEEKLSSSGRSIRQSDFRQTVVTQAQIWAMLTEEGIVGDEQVVYKQVLDTNGSKAGFVAEISNQLPSNLELFRTSITGWLQQHHGQEFSSASAILGPITIEQSSSLTKFLENKSLIVQTKCASGRLLKTLSTSDSESGHSLPDRWKAYLDPLVEWIKFCHKGESDGDSVFVFCDSLPFPKDTQEGIHQVWSYLISEGVVKERSVQFPKRADEDEVKSRTEEIKKTVESMTKIRDLCEMYRPNSNVDKITSSDVLTYLRNNTMEAIDFATENTAEVVSNPIGFIIDSIEIGKLEEYRKKNENVIKEWLNQKEKNEKLETYVNDVVSALVSSAGQFRTMPFTSASFRPLIEYFSGGKCPAEVDNFEDQIFDQVIILKEYKSWWDWRAFWVAMIGVAQIVVGGAISVASGGLLSSIGNAFIMEGIGDIIFAIQSGLTGTFSWRAYRSHKIWSVGISILTAGIGTYLTFSKMAVQSSRLVLKSRSAWSLLLAVGKKVLCKVGQAVKSALCSLAIDKFLAFLRKFILDEVLAFIRANFNHIFQSAFKEMRKAMDSIWTHMKMAGRSLTEVKTLISNSLNENGNSGLHSIWLSQLASAASSVGNAMCNCFSESSRILEQQSGQMKSQGLSKVLDNVDVAGFDFLNGAINAIDTAKQLAALAEKATKIMKWMTAGVEIATLLAYAPEYVSYVNKKLNAESLNVEKKNAEAVAGGKGPKATTSSESEKTEFEMFKADMEKKVGDEVLKHILDRVESVWVKPYLQRKMERVIRNIGEKTIQFMGSLFEDDQGGIERARSRAEKDQEMNGKRRKSSREKNTKRRRTQFSNELTQDLEFENGSQDEQGETYRAGTNQFGERIVEPKTHQEFCDEIGQGEKAGPLVLQLMANMTGRPIKIDDTVGDYGAVDGKDGYTFKPNGKDSNEAPIVMRYTANADGSKHVSYVGSDGNMVELPVDGSAPANRCAYEALAAATGKTADQVVAELKAHAIKDPRIKYMYDLNINQAFPHLKAGAKRTRQDIEVTKQSKSDKDLKDVSGDRSKRKRAEALIAEFNISSADPNAGIKTYKKNEAVRIDLQGVHNTPKDGVPGMGTLKGDERWGNFQIQENIPRGKNQATSIGEVHVEAGKEFNPRDIRNALVSSAREHKVVWLRKLDPSSSSKAQSNRQN